MSAQQLCLACGLCCDGTMFHHVSIESDEVEPLRRFGLPIASDEVRMPQPCTAHVNGRCEAYTVRPKACVSFRCRLLTRLESGEITEAAARAVLTTILDAARELRTAAAGRTRPLRLVLEPSDAMDPTFRREHADLLLSARVLKLLLQRELEHT